MKSIKRLLENIININPSSIPSLIEYAESIGLNIKIVTLTGGPCAGKTDSLIHLDIEFTKRGYQVILLPEAATIVRNQGFRAEQGVYSTDACQRMMIMQNEFSLITAIITAIESHKEGENKKMLIVRDRSSLDGATYVNSLKLFEASLVDMRFSIQDIKYSDATIFLRTLAFDRPDLYKKFSSNNTARFENVDQAVAADHKLLEVYERYGHPYIVNNNFVDFREKVNHVVDIIIDILGEPRLEKELSFMLLDPNKEFISKLGLNNSVDITQFYMSDSTRYRRVDYPGKMHSSYIRTVKLDTDDKSVRMETEVLIPASEYVSAEESDLRRSDYVEIKKTRYFKNIELDGIHYILEVDEFKNPLLKDWLRIEIEYGLKCPDPKRLFDGFKYVDITGDSRCSNRGISKGELPLNLFD